MIQEILAAIWQNS